VGLAFEQYLRTIVADVDGVICISRTVAGDLSDWLFQERITRRTPLRIGWFHLGADFPCVDAMEARTDAPDMVNRALMRPLALIVGSLEYRSDRKGYGQAIDAFELLWGRGYDVALALVGKRVSPKDKLTERITHHSEYGRLLFWFEKPSDCVLTKLYKSATVLLHPSHGEGFGVPLVEAGSHDLPIIARDLPIFREIAGDHICYFDGYGGSDLVDAIESFFVLQKQGRVPSSSGMKPLSWAQSAEQLLSIIFDDQWSTTYGPYQPLN
jgi:glycosyltransferase involved in cell wall biosynthesis